MSVDAAATLTLAIETGKARQDLAELKAEYLGLRESLSKGLTLSGLGDQIKTLQATLSAVGAGVSSVNKALDDIVRAGGKFTNELVKGARAAVKENALLTDSFVATSKAASSASKTVDQYSALLVSSAPVTTALSKTNALLTDSFVSVATSSRGAGKSMVEYDSMMGSSSSKTVELVKSNALLTDSLTAVARSYRSAGKALVEYDALMGAVTKSARPTGNALLTSSAIVSSSGAVSRSQASGTYDALMNSASVSAVVVEEEASHKKAARAAEDHAQATKLFSAAAKEAHDGVRGLSGALGNLWLTYGSLIPLLAGAAIGSSFVQAAKYGSDFNYQLTLMKGLGQESAHEIGRVSEAALTLSQNSTQGPVEMAKGFRMLVEAGISASDAIVTMNSVLALAAAGEMSVESAGKTMIGVLNAFDIGITGISRVGDVFTKAAAMSQTSVEQMAEAMKTASVVHSQYGASLEDTAAALTLLAKVNITGTAAGTSLRNMLKDLYTPGKQAEDLFKSLGISVEDSQHKMRSFSDILSDIRNVLERYDKPSQTRMLGVMFSERGGKEALQLLQKTREEWGKLTEEISQSQGFLAGISDELNATAKGTFTQAINTLGVDLVRAFNSTEGPMKDMAVRLKGLFQSPEFQQGVLSAINLMGSLASSVLTVVSAVTSLVSSLGKGAGSFASMALAVGASTLVISSAILKIEAMVSGIAALAAAEGALLLTMSPVIIAVGALAGAYALLSSNTPDAVNGMVALNSALDSQISRLRVVNEELNKKLGYERGSAAVDKTTAQKTLQAAKDRLAEYDRALQDEGKDGSTVIGRMLDSLFTTDEDKRKAYAMATEARVNRTKLEKEVREASLKLSIAEGTEDMIRLNSSKAMTNELIKQQELNNSIKTGTGVWNKPDKKNRDTATPLEKSEISSLAEQQKFETALLDSKHRNNLITEEQYQADLAKIYEKWNPQILSEYDASLARLAAARDRASGQDREALQTKFNNMATARRKFMDDEELRVQQSSDREAGIIKKSGEELVAIIKEQEAATAQIRERLAANRLKLDMTPEESASYEARKSVEKSMDKIVAKREAEVENLLNAGYTEESDRLQAVRRELELTIEARQRLGDEAAAQAAEEVGFSRSYEAGWKKAFRTWTNEGTNAAKTAADSFKTMTDAMENALDTFLSTGKLSFADFAKSVILSMAKIEGKALLSSALKSVGGDGGGGFSGLLGSLAKWIGIGGSSSGTVGGTIAGVMTNGVANLLGGVAAANGAVFSGSSSLHAYADTVQTSPRVFTFQNLYGFSRGGVFAEAGPEAVMPLIRDSRGRLGVRASNDGPALHITVNVNGNSNAQDVRRSAGQGAREALAALSSTRRFA